MIEMLYVLRLFVGADQKKTEKTVISASASIAYMEMDYTVF